jgi:hypothetical protein
MTYPAHLGDEAEEDGCGNALAIPSRPEKVEVIGAGSLSFKLGGLLDLGHFVQNQLVPPIPVRMELGEELVRLVLPIAVCEPSWRLDHQRAQAPDEDRHTAGTLDDNRSAPRPLRGPVCYAKRRPASYGRSEEVGALKGGSYDCAEARVGHFGDEGGRANLHE